MNFLSLIEIARNFGIVIYDSIYKPFLVVSHKQKCYTNAYGPLGVFILTILSLNLTECPDSIRD